ncbi:YdcF family protein [Thermoflavimicrobium daqui]|uniref:YdcF family protein n=1 Tax=Thermoflavimicrobium daqui TaxID=2137476 RepID=A0A364K7J0_9BACL|nr:YdcF family protein [Thermoflavimicrobium daqui]RAL26170.1 YdcF family protein [Thermoflavimicrobium daqui]
MSIPKQPTVPPLSKQEIKIITDLTFLQPADFPQLESYDLLFVFGGSHPEIWQTVAKAYHEGKAKQLLITGGYMPGKKRPDSWIYGTTPEAHVIQMKLIELGVKKEQIIIEDRSTNSLENVRYAKEIFDFDTIQTMLFASKAFASGRQYRTLKKYLPDHVLLSPLLVHSTLQNKKVTRDDWMKETSHRSIVYGEYLRIYEYGKKGDIALL